MAVDLSLISGRRYLVVDDDETSCQLVMTFLQRAMPKCQIRSASDGIEGVKVAQEWNPHVLFTDINMPNMDGLELLMRLKMEQPEIQVVVYTARDDLDAAIQALTHGASDYLHKPLEMQELLLACKRALERLILVEDSEARIADLELIVSQQEAELEKLNTKLDNN